MGSNYATYWMSSRCVNADSGGAYFYVLPCVFRQCRCLLLVRFLRQRGLCIGYAFRPVITLNSNVQIDTANSGNGSTANDGYAIK